MGEGLPRACEVLVLSLHWLPDRSALKVLGVRVGDVANRPVTFLLKQNDAADLQEDLKRRYNDEFGDPDEDVIIEIDPKFVIPVIRNREALEPVPGTSAT